MLRPQERDTLKQHLEVSRQALLAEVRSLSTAQWNFQLHPAVWSVAAIVEHLTITEEAIARLLKYRLLRSPLVENTLEAQDAIIRLRLLNRTSKAQSPEMVRPTEIPSQPETAIHEFQDARQRTIDYANRTNDDLRRHSAPHPGLGELDGYQWLLFLAAHTERHAAQIQEIKTASGYPAE